MPYQHRSGIRQLDVREGAGGRSFARAEGRGAAGAFTPDASRARLEPRERASAHVAHLCLRLNYSEL